MQISLHRYERLDVSSISYIMKQEHYSVYTISSMIHIAAKNADRSPILHKLLDRLMFRIIMVR